MKKHSYRAKKVNDINWNLVKENLAGGAAVLAVDVAKEKQYALLSTGSLSDRIRHSDHCHGDLIVLLHRYIEHSISHAALRSISGHISSSNCNTSATSVTSQSSPIQSRSDRETSFIMIASSME